MTSICYVDKNFRESSMHIIDQANEIIEEYALQGFSLTLRQLYYQFVARDLVPNTERSYKRIGSIINDGRMAGLIDWESIEDRTRNVVKQLHLDNPAHAIKTVRDQYGIDMWANQPQRVEVWIEKEALVGVISRVCAQYDVPYFACRGYVSQSEQWRAAQRMRHTDTVILHLGDHDPSGMDMTRDNQDRLNVFNGWGHCVPDVLRIALNMDQIEEYSPPPNPAKMTDSRFGSYISRYGSSSWELDAMEPSVMVDLIEHHILSLRDEDLWQERQSQLEIDLATMDSIIDGLQ